MARRPPQHPHIIYTGVPAFRQKKYDWTFLGLSLTRILGQNGPCLQINIYIYIYIYIYINIRSNHFIKLIFNFIKLIFKLISWCYITLMSYKYIYFLKILIKAVIDIWGFIFELKPQCRPPFWACFYAAIFYRCGF